MHGNCILAEECGQYKRMCDGEGLHIVHDCGRNRLGEYSSQEHEDEFENTQVSVKKFSHREDADFRKRLPMAAR